MYLGILIAAVNALVHLFSIGAVTGWSILVIAVDTLIIYGLALQLRGP